MAGRNHANRELLQTKGTSLWVPHPSESYIRAIVVDSSGEQGILVKAEDGQTFAVNLSDVDLCTTSSQLLTKIDDLTKLPALNEASLLATLHERFKVDTIYTYTGPILLAVNPFKRLPLYSDKILTTYIKASNDAEAFANLSPHPYAIAARAFSFMAQTNGRNQSILVSGESGAGKTETTKIVLKYLTTASNRNPSPPSTSTTSTGGTSSSKEHVSIADRVLQANPLMEAFGNAKTVRNDNSSRFGKMILMHFNSQNLTLMNSSTATYLLEKGRVIHQAPGERNYHIFYELAAGLSSEQRKRWFLDDISSYAYTNKSNTYTRSDIQDTDQFMDTLRAMDVVGMTEDERDFMFRTVIGVLTLGNVNFTSHGEEGSKISKDSIRSAEAAAKLFGTTRKHT